MGRSQEFEDALAALGHELSKPYSPPAKEKKPNPYGGYISQNQEGHLISEGKPVQKLYRVVDPGEWQEAQKNGYLQSTQAGRAAGYTRASLAPDERWRYQGSTGELGEKVQRGHTLEIDYHPDDKWHASAEGYAATKSQIPLHRVRRID